MALALHFSSLSFAHFPNFCKPMLSKNAIAIHQRSFLGGRIEAPFGLNGTEESPAPVPASGGKEKSTPVENLPLQSKVQELEQQRLKMKLAKKIRLRRKRLVQKRHLRKKGHGRLQR